MSKELENHLLNAPDLSTGAPIESISWLRHLVLGFLVGTLLQIPTPAQLEQNGCSGIGPHAVPRAENKLGRLTGSSRLRVPYSAPIDLFGWV